jgi:hypothetical protein
LGKEKTKERNIRRKEHKNKGVGEGEDNGKEHKKKGDESQLLCLALLFFEREQREVKMRREKRRGEERR